jgi:hypothetical protein
LPGAISFAPAATSLACRRWAPSSTPTATANASTDPNAALLQIAAILDRGTPSFFEPRTDSCKCAGCQDVRRHGILCELCGFEGTPIVDVCTCADERASDIRVYHEMISRIESGESGVIGGVEDLPALRQLLAQREAEPPPPHPAGSPDCAHGNAWCPTCCGSIEGNEIIAEAKDLIEIIRQVRAVLRAHLSAGRA